MKIRQGFVSNSSSSSFIVPFPKGMTINPLTVHEFLYGTEPTCIVSYGEPVTSMAASKVVSDAMLNQEPNDKTAIEEALTGYLGGEPDRDYTGSFQELGAKEWNRQFALYEQELQAYRDKVLQEHTSKWGDDVDLYVFSFCDNDGHFWATLEHGGTFDNVPHLAVSHH
jgi:hypothetical protein